MIACGFLVRARQLAKLPRLCGLGEEPKGGHLSANELLRSDKASVPLAGMRVSFPEFMLLLFYGHDPPICSSDSSLSLAGDGVARLTPLFLCLRLWLLAALSGTAGVASLQERPLSAAMAMPPARPTNKATPIRSGGLGLEGTVVA